MLRKKNSEPAQLPEARQELLEFESPAAQPGKKDPKQFLKHNWKKIAAVVCVAAVAAAVLLSFRKSLLYSFSMLRGTSSPKWTYINLPITHCPP